MKNKYNFLTRQHWLLLLIGALSLTLSTNAPGRTPLADPLTLTAPSYNCATGAITFNTTGGDGSTITYNAPGIMRSSLTSNTGIIEQGLRNDPKPITIQATQSGQTTSYTFDLKAACSTTTSELPSPILAAVDDIVLRLDQSLTYPAIEISSRLYNPAISDDYKAWAIIAQGLPPGMRLSTSVLMKTFFLVSITGYARPVGIYPITVKAVNTRAPQNPPFVTTFTITVVDNSAGTAFALLAPSYNCATGAITFNTTGGNGTPITYSAPGITGPTTNPNQFVDAGLRQAADAQPLILSATQNGATVTYRFDLRATCPIGTNPPVQANQDREILVDLYNSTNGAGWTKKTNWLQGDSPCNWFGVSCDTNGRVTELYLYNNNLNGTLPVNLGDLSQLLNLNLGINRLSGSIPTSLGNLLRLTDLSLPANQLSGSIPASIGNMSRLINIYLNSNRLSSSIPSSLGNLSNLTTLNLGTNQLSGSIPISLGNLLKLENIDLASNQLSGSIPASFSNLLTLKSINLYLNMLNGSIPASLGSLLKLGNINLANNQLSGSIPANLGNLPRLFSLVLSNNSLTGSIPSSLAKATNLMTLHLNNNQLSGCLPVELTSLCNKGIFILMSSNPGLPGGGDFASFCSNGTGACPITPTTGLALVTPTYNCVTGAINFNTTGGDGSTITYQAPGIMRSSLTSNTGTVEQGLRNDPKPITIQAIQSGHTTSYTFDLKAFCEKGDIRLYGVDTTFFAGYFDYKVGEGTYDPSNPIDRWSKTVTGLPPETYFNYRIQDDQKTYTLHVFGTKDNKAGSFPITITIVNPRYPNQPVSNSFTITFKKYGPTPGNLALSQPTYNCATGAFTFNTTGGNGTLIEYQAPGITGWTTNPNQFVDKDSRTANDVQPFALMARQSGNVVTYTWDLKQACGRARVAAEGAGTTLSLQLLGNPAREQVRVLITGAEGQAVQLRLTDLQGRLLESRTVEQAGAAEEQQFRLDQAGPHMLLLQATRQQQVRTVKIIRQ